MADKTIGSLPSVTTPTDGIMIPVEQSNAAKKITFGDLIDYIVENVQPSIDGISIIEITKGDTTVSTTAKDIYDNAVLGVTTILIENADVDVSDFVSAGSTVGLRNVYILTTATYCTDAVATATGTAVEAVFTSVGSKNITDGYKIDNSGNLTRTDRFYPLAARADSTVRSPYYLSLESDPINQYHAVNKKYVDALIQDAQISAAVSSVNNKTGDVVLKTSDIQNDSGYVTTNNAGDYAPVQSVNGKTGSVITDPDVGENYVDSITPTYYYSNCRGLGNGVLLPYKTVSGYQRFRVNTIEPLKAGTTYSISFKVSGADGIEPAPKLKLVYLTAQPDNYNRTIATIPLVDGTVKKTFTPNYNSAYSRVLLTDADLYETRPQNEEIYLYDFKIEKESSATGFVPSVPAIYELSQAEYWKKVQDRIYQEAFNQFPLYFVSGKTEAAITSGTVDEYSDYQPKAVYSWARKEMSVIANFKASSDISDGDTILTGLPPIFVTTGLKVYNALSWVADGKLKSAHAIYATENFERVSSIPSTVVNGKSILVTTTGKYYLGVNGSWTLRYEPSGVLKFEAGDDTSLSIPSGTLVRFESRPIPLSTPYGAYRMQRITSDDVALAAAWMVSARGKYDYSNNGRWRRKLYSDSTQPFSGYGATDCSGIIHQAFRYGAGKFVPDGSKSQVSFGRIISYARKGEYLDISKLRVGDIVGYIEAAGVGEIWAVNHVAMAVSVNDEIQLWNVSSSYGTEYAADYSHGEIVNSKDKPRSSVGSSKTFGPQPVRGTYESVDTQDVYIYRDDAEKSYYDARIVVRWTDDYAILDSDFEFEG